MDPPTLNNAKRGIRLMGLLSHTPRPRPACPLLHLPRIKSNLFIFV
eukprot:TCALIF_11529-PA protein Name:"Protein of unknown function" AED:0.67 eAED:0.72 QI:8/0/0/1/0/0/2/88/45